MQRVCTKCNTLVTGDGAFCPSCGEPLPAAVQLEKTPQTTPMGASLKGGLSVMATLRLDRWSYTTELGLPMESQL